MNLTLLARTFGFSLVFSVVVLAAVLVGLGPGALLVALILTAIEIAFSFDNAIINATVLRGLSSLWQKLFLSVGIIIAIFGMRLVFPVLVVALSAHLPWGQVVDLALHRPELYGAKLAAAGPSIAAFGGAFLLMLCLHFFTAERQVKWLELIERPLSRFGAWWLPAAITGAALIILAAIPANHYPAETLRAGFFGLLIYLLVHGFIRLIDLMLGRKQTSGRPLTGWPALATFFYLELLDASFSFDGVIGAFAITSKVILIAIGLGIGAVWVRSLTVFMVKHETLNRYKFLEHGAHYAVLALAIAMLTGEIINIPDFVTGLTGIGIILASLAASRQARAV